MPGHRPGWGVPKPCWWPDGLGGVGALFDDRAWIWPFHQDFGGGVNHGG